MSDDKDARIAELEEKLADECNTALKTTIHDQRRELKRLNERIAELEQQRDALAAKIGLLSGAALEYTDGGIRSFKGSHGTDYRGWDEICGMHHDNALASRLAQERKAEQRRCIRIVRNEEELDGDPPEEISRDFRSIDAAVLHLRAVVRATKRSIIAQIERGEVGK